MRQEFLGSAVTIALGITVILRGNTWTGSVVALVGIAHLAFKWRLRDVRPIDPVFSAELDKMMKLEKSDPAAAGKLLDRALLDADRREELELADLLRRASTDRNAAIELRSRLRGKLRTGQAARRKAENYALKAPDRDAVLKEMDRLANKTEQQLAQVEQYLEMFRL